MTTKEYISIEAVTKRYGDSSVIEDVSFVIPKGSISAIIGPNGAGKSTLAKMIMGIISPNSGTVAIDGQKPEQYRKKIGYVPQRFTFNPKVPITVEEFLMLSLHVAGKHEHEERSIIENRFERVGLPNSTLNKQLSELSGGQLQRMLVARALLTDKELLIMDEPVAGLDIEGRQSIHEMLKKLNKDHGVTIILISHELEVVFTYAEHVLCINRRMLCQGKPEETLTEEVLTEMYGSQHQAHYHHKCVTH